MCQFSKGQRKLGEKRGCKDCIRNGAAGTTSSNRPIPIMMECASCHLQNAKKREFSKRQQEKGALGRCKGCTQKEAFNAANERSRKKYAKQREKDEEERRIGQLRWEKYEAERKLRYKKKLEFRQHHLVPPPHPDEGKWKDWKNGPDQTMRIHSGGFCFGLGGYAQYAASRPLQTFEEMTRRSSAKGNQNRISTNVTVNSVARNGTWNAYKIPRRNKKGGESIGGWIVCHENSDPVVEIRNILFDSFEDHFGGAQVGNDWRTNDRHKERGLVIIPRYIIAITDGGQPVKGESIYFVDYDQAKESNPIYWDNAIQGMSAGIDWAIARLAYDNDGLCKSFLLWGDCCDFLDAYFEEGTAPLGQAKWELDCCCPEHGFTGRHIGVGEYLEKSGTTLCLPRKSKTRNKTSPSAGNAKAMNASINTNVTTTGTKKRKSSSAVPDSQSSGTNSGSIAKQRKITDFFKKQGNDKLCGPAQSASTSIVTVEVART